MLLIAPYSISPNHFPSPLHSAPSLESFYPRIKKLKPKNKGVNHKKKKGNKHYQTGHFLNFPLMVVV
jgi:hypothetical protein